MRFEGTLDAFSLPDILQLLSFTKKTGTLHLRREGGHGVVHLKGGAISGGRADVTRQELGRRLLGAGLVDDEVLATVAEQLADDPCLSLATLLTSSAALSEEVVGPVAAEQVADAVFSLLRWPEGEFAFVVDELDPDDLGAALPVETVVAEAQRRISGWGEVVDAVPAPSTVLAINPAPEQEPAASREEWPLVALVDGRRTVADLVALSGRGEYAVVSCLATLVERGLLVVRTELGDQLARRQALLAALEGRTDEALCEVGGPDAAAPSPKVVVPELGVAAEGPGTSSQFVAPSGTTSSAVVPARPEPFTAPRRPEHAEASPAYAKALAGGAGSHGAVSGATALQAAPEAASRQAVIDPAVDRTLLLRLIAGVRGL